MLIFNSFSVSLSTLCQSVVFVLCIFSFLKTENFYFSATECLTLRGQNETKSNRNIKDNKVNKDMSRYLICKKKGLSSVDNKIAKECQ